MQVTIDGVTAATLGGTLQVQAAIGQRSTCNFTAWDATGASHFEQGMAVVVTNDDSSVAFSGFVDNSTETKPGAPDTTLLLYQVQCVDMHYLADKRLAATTYTNTLAGDIISDLVAHYLAGEGVIGRHLTVVESDQTTFAAGTLSGVTSAVGGLKLPTAYTAPAFTRASTAYRRNDGVQVTSGNPRYEPGGLASTSALRLEEGATNLLSANQSSVETDTTGLDVVSGTTLTRDTTQQWSGAASLKVVTPGGSSNQGMGAKLLDTSYSNGETITVSVWLRGTGTVVLKIVETGVQQFANTANITLTSTWTRYSVTGTLSNPLTSGHHYGIEVTTASAQAITFFVDGLQIEQGNHVTSWQLGGAARVAETLVLPAAGVILPAQGTLEFRANFDSSVRRQVAGVNQRLVNIPNSGAGNAIKLYHEAASANWTVMISNDAGSSNLTASFADTNTGDGWHHVALAWDAISLIVYVDGVSKATVSSPVLPSVLATSWWLGSDASSAQQADALYQDVRISTRKRSGTEIAADSASTSLAAVDRDTAYLLPLNAAFTVGEGGYRIWPSYSLTPLDVARGGTVSWVVSTPASTAFGMETSLDGGATWHSITSGGTISGLVALTSTAGVTLLLRESLTTTDRTNTPALTSVTVALRNARIADGPTLTAATFGYIPVSQAIDQVAEIAGYWWIIDQDARLWFQPDTAIAAPFAVSSDDMDQDSVKVVHTTPNYRNTQYILGITAQTSSQVETRKGDGVSRAFTMSYELAMVPTVTVNAVAKTVGIKGVDTGKDWYWSKGDPILSQDTGGTILLGPDDLGGPDTLSVTYIGQYAAIVKSQDDAGIATRQSLEGGTTSGIVEDAAQIANVTSTDQGFAIANGRLARYSVIGSVQITFDMLLSGLAPGQLLAVTMPENDIDDTFLIESITITDQAPNQYLIYTVVATDGPTNTDWATFFDNLATNASQAGDLSIGATGIVALTTTPSETWTWTESITETVYACPVPNTTLFPSTTLFPC